MWELIRFYSRTGRQEIAFNYVNQLVERMDDPGKAAGCYLAMGQLMEQVRDYERAMEFYEQAIVLEPDTKQVAYLVNNNMGYCLNYVGRFQEAEPYCRRAISVDPERYNAYKNLGISLEGQGHIGAAAQCYIIAVHANDHDPRALRHLEDLIKNNRGVAAEINDINEQLEACRKAVKAAHDLKMKIAKDDTKCSA
jgi:tetratricopeptide (TPR) repeat protein